MRLHVAVSGEMVALIDAKAAQLAAEAPGATILRSEVIRRALHAYVVQR